MTAAGTLLAALAGGILLYSYAVYPLTVLVLAWLRPRPAKKKPWQPYISFIITAHNEERHITQKIENTLALAYPTERLEVLVASDGSTDRTNALVESFRSRGVRLVASPHRVGKTLATQRAVREASGELLVFSDATGLFSPDALQHLASASADPSVGCVSGRVEYEYGESPIASGFRLYQRFEKMLRRAESACGILTSVSGSIHAVRRSLFPPAEAHQNYDLLLPLDMASRGLRSVYANDAASRETARTRTGEEFQARVRASIQALSYLAALHRHGWVLRYPLFAWAAVSHKVLRWFTPVWLMLLLCAHALLATRGGVWMWTLLPHLGVYLLAALGAALPAGRCSPWLAAPTFVGTVCFGFLVGMFSFLRGSRAAAWDSPR